MNREIFVTRAVMPPYEEYIEAIKPLWESHWVTNMGQYHQQLEKQLREYLDVPQLSLMVNGHMSLEMALQSFGFPDGGEVLTTPFTFISTTHAIVRSRLTPVFCDVKLTDGTIDEDKIEELITPRTVAILPVHVYGNTCNVEEIGRIAHKYGLKVIYDAAHAFGVTRQGCGIGSYGDASIYSFHATKIFNTIEGGAIAFTDPAMYEKLYNLKNFGIHGEELVTDIGANAKMNEFCAIMGLCNLKYVDETIAAREKRCEQYREQLEGTEGIRFLAPDPAATRNYAYLPILVDESYPLSRDALYDRLKAEGIHARKYFYPTTADQACFRNRYKKVEIPNARWLAEHVLTLPLYGDMAKDDVDRVIAVICEGER